MKLLNRIYNDKNFMSLTNSILTHKEYVKTKSIVHHGSTRFDHSIKVAYLTYKVSKIFGWDVNSATRGAALHDFFLVRDDKNILTSAKMFVEHPTLAKENSIKYFGVNEKEQNIIESHMFPASKVAPKSKEAWIVTFADKVVALFDGATTAKAKFALWTMFLINIIR